MTDMRSELSKKNKYWIGKHRFLELRHYCLQYPDWQRVLIDIGYGRVSYIVSDTRKIRDLYDETQRVGIIRAEYSRNIDLIERVAKETDDQLWDYILKAVTKDLSYTYLETVMHIPCSRGTYFDRYRKFFWLLDKEKGL